MLVWGQAVQGLVPRVIVTGNVASGKFVCDRKRDDNSDYLKIVENVKANISI